MGMEHRCGTRRVIDAGVIIDSRPAGLVHGRIRNISVGGVFVRMRPIPGMTNDRVKIVFVRHDRGVCRIYRLPAVIVRWTRDGAGLMFSELTSNSFYALLAILLAEERRNASRKAAVGQSAPSRRPGGSWFKK
ncbi:MAG TPA: PilZ domain-containing protein [Burkholderiales bacterium]